jgi:hypothetical protein
MTDLNCFVFAFTDENADTLQALLLELYDPFVECGMENLLGKTIVWINKAKLIDQQSVFVLKLKE